MASPFAGRYIYLLMQYKYIPFTIETAVLLATLTHHDR
jgi:hypothetical protein